LLKVLYTTKKYFNNNKCQKYYLTLRPCLKYFWHQKGKLMDKVEMYTRATCGYCKAAKSFLNNHKIEFKEYPVEQWHNLEKMLSRSLGSKTVPQIFWNNNHLGGYDDMIEAFNNKKIILDKELK